MGGHNALTGDSKADTKGTPPRGPGQRLLTCDFSVSIALGASASERKPGRRLHVAEAMRALCKEPDTADYGGMPALTVIHLKAALRVSGRSG